MNDSLLKKHLNLYSEQLKSRRLWNILIFTIFVLSFFISSSIIDFNLSKIIEGFPRLGDYIVKILPNIDYNLIFENSKTEGSIKYWYFNFKKYAALLYETFNMAILSTLMGFIFALLLSFLSAKNITPNIYSYHLVKRFLEFLRGVPEIIFAILFVWALGVGPLAGIIGSIQANEVVKEILGIGNTLCGFILIVDALKLTFRKVKLNKRTGCNCHARKK